MKISLWMLADQLTEYEPQIFCDYEGVRIKEIRISTDGACSDPEILYLGTSDLFFHDDSDRIVCKNASDYLTLNTSTLYEALNSVLNAFGHFARWAETCSDLISSGCSLSELLDLSEELLGRPLSVVDGSQRRIAYSKGFATYRNDDNWHAMMDHPDFRLVPSYLGKQPKTCNTDRSR